MQNDAVTGAPAESYRERRDRYQAAARQHERRARRISLARVLVFLAALAFGLVLERTRLWWSLAGSIGAGVGFVALVLAHQRARARRAWYLELATLNAQGLYRLARAWDRLPERAPARTLDAHAYAADLDLYGRAALTQILGPPGSAAGAATLDAWLLEGAPPDVVRERQAAVRELAARHDVTEPLAVHAARTRSTRDRDVARFLGWAEAAPWLHRHRLLRTLSWLVPGATALLIAAHAAGLIAHAYWLVTLLAALIIYFVHGARIRGIFDEAFGREALFAHYPAMLELLATTRFDAPLLRRLADRLVQDAVPAHVRIAALARLMHHADLRHSSLHLPVFLVTLWDLHVLRGLTRWQHDAGGSVRAWLDTLGAFEALAALAVLHHDQPDWSFPELDPSADTVSAQQLGHPLLPEQTRVPNDVTVGPAGSFLLVTGSNMSGKSTLLRALGLNAVLAQAGAPVCARSMRLPPLEVYTSIRVQDSLARGVSYFMAELERLKQVVDAAHSTADADRSRQLFLLDEILHGTNSAERRIAARHVIHHLVDAGAIGAVTTHDLELVDEPALRDAARLVHFREQVTETALTFDYQLRPGLATSTNALQLMRLVGL